MSTLALLAIISLSGLPACDDSPVSAAIAPQAGLPQFSWWSNGDEEPLEEPTPLPHKFMWPLKVLEISSSFGQRDGKWHKGMDLRAPKGTKVLAAGAGTVVFSGEGEHGYGNTIIIDHGEGVYTLYAHNNRNIAVPGDVVRRGDLIAHVGKTGTATGYHLHFEVRLNGRPIDPEPALPAHSSGKR